MLFSKEDSKNLSRIANALEQLTEAVLNNNGLEFFRNKEKAIEETKVEMYSSDMEEVAEEEYSIERMRISKKLQEKEALGETTFFPEESLTGEDLEYMQD